MCVADGFCQEKRCLFSHLVLGLVYVFVSSTGFAGTPVLLSAAPNGLWEAQGSDDSHFHSFVPDF